MTRQAFGVVTDQGAFVRTDVLDNYAVKESRQLVDQSTFEGERALLRPKYDPSQLASLLEASTPHLVACRQKAEDTIGRGWELVEVRKGADTKDRDRILAWFDEVPAPDKALDSHGYDSVFHAAQFDFEAIGRGVLELIRVNKDPRGEPETLVHVPAHTIRLARDGIRFVQSKGGKRRWFKWAGAPYDLDYESGELKDLGDLRPERRANEIIWWRNYHPSDPVYGLPDIIPAVGAIHGDLGRRDYNIDFFSNYGVPAYAVFITGDFDPGDPVDSDGNPVDEGDPAGRTPLEWQIDRLLKQVRDNPHSNLVFTIPTVEGREDGEVKIEFKPLATEVKEASFRMFRKDNREEILSSHRMSNAIAGVYDAGASNREARGQYKQSVVWPRRRSLQAVVNHFVVAAFGDTGWRWRIRPLDSREEVEELDLMDRLLTARVVSRLEVRRKFADRLGLDPDAIPDDQDAGIQAVGVPALLAGRVITRNEARGMLGLDETPGGDEFLDPAVDDVEVALRSMRDDLVTLAAKARDAGKPDPTTTALSWLGVG